MKVVCFLAFTLAFAALAISDRPALADGDAGSGQDLFRACTACHEVGVGAKNRVGPVLNDIVGRRAASRDGFSYSRGMREASSEGLVWSAATLDGYIENPRGYVRGTRMAFAGIQDPQLRQDLIAFLKTLKFDKPAESGVLR